MQSITYNPTALVIITIHQYKCKPQTSIGCKPSMFIDFKFTYITTSPTNKFILCNNIINNESITIHNVPIIESVVSVCLHCSGCSASADPTNGWLGSCLVKKPWLIPFYGRLFTTAHAVWALALSCWRIKFCPTCWAKGCTWGLESK